MELSKYQKDVMKFMEEPKNGSLVIEAFAGSGKTTTNTLVAKMLAKQGYIVGDFAFNKSIVADTKEKLKGVNNVFVKTMHSCGYAALTKYLGRKPKADDKKWYRYLNNNIDSLSIAKFEKDNEKNSFIKNCIKLLTLCRVNLIKADDLKGINEVAEHHNLDLDFDEAEVVSKCLEFAYVADRNNIYDFIDMITLPTTDKRIAKYLDKYDVVIIDEAQDLNKAQQALMMAMLNKGGRFMAVGDHNQSINGFCGADTDSFNNLIKLANGHTLPLSVSYRCSKAVIEEAHNYVKDIEPFENNALGEVKHTDNFNDLKNGDMIISRVSAPLISLCLKLISKGISAKVKGTDIAEGMKDLINQSNKKDIPSLYLWLDKELQNKMEKLMAFNSKIKNIEHCPSIEMFKDKIDSIKAIGDTCRTIKELNDKLDKIFSDYKSNNMIMLSTIHKAKGLEADNVFIILPNKLPLTFKGQSEWEKQQELNLCYVAVTRAKKCLTYIDLDNQGLNRLEI